MYTCYIQNFKILASFCSWAGWFESCLVANPRRHIFAWCGSFNVYNVCHSRLSLPLGAVGRLWFMLVSPCASPLVFEPRHDKTNKMSVRPARTQISLGIRPVWSESSLCAQWVANDPRFLHADSEDSDQTGRMPRLIWVFAGRTVILLVLSCRGSLIRPTWVLTPRRTVVLSKYCCIQNIG